MKIPDYVLACNCAGCGRLLLCTFMDARLYQIPMVAGRVKGRPYCDPCLESQAPPPGPAPGRSDRQFHGGMWARGEW